MENNHFMICLWVLECVKKIVGSKYFFLILSRTHKITIRYDMTLDFSQFHDISFARNFKFIDVI